MAYIQRGKEWYLYILYYHFCCQLQFILKIFQIHEIHCPIQYTLSASRNYKLLKNISLRCVLNFIYTAISLRGLPPVISAMLASKEKHHLCGEVSTSFCLHYKKKRRNKHLPDTGSLDNRFISSPAFIKGPVIIMLTISIPLWVSGILILRNPIMTHLENIKLQKADEQNPSRLAFDVPEDILARWNFKYLSSCELQQC